MRRGKESVGSAEEGQENEGEKERKTGQVSGQRDSEAHRRFQREREKIFRGQGSTLSQDLIRESAGGSRETNRKEKRR